MCQKKKKKRKKKGVRRLAKFKHTVDASIQGLEDYIKISKRDLLQRSVMAVTSGRALYLSLDCSTLSLICTLYCRVLSKEVSSTIFKVCGMKRSGIEHMSPGSLANTLPTGPNEN